MVRQDHDVFNGGIASFQVEHCFGAKSVEVSAETVQKFFYSMIFNEIGHDRLDPVPIWGIVKIPMSEKCCRDHNASISQCLYRHGLNFVKSLYHIPKDNVYKIIVFGENYFMQISVEFQNRFKELTEESDFGNKTIAAEKIGITYATFSKIYNYGIVPKVSVLIKIADRFGVSLEYLLAHTDDDRFLKAEPPKAFKDRLILLKEQKGLKSFYALADQVHIHKSNISQWLIKDYLPDIESLEILADYFGVSLDYLLGRTDSEN